MTSAGFQFSPGEFKVKDADPEQTLERFELYLEAIQKAFRLNRRVNPTTGAKVDFDDQDKKDIIQLEGGHDMVDLFKHVGKVQEGIPMTKQWKRFGGLSGEEGTGQQRYSNFSRGWLRYYSPV